MYDCLLAKIAWTVLGIVGVASMVLPVLMVYAVFQPYIAH